MHGCRTPELDETFEGSQGRNEEAASGKQEVLDEEEGAEEAPGKSKGKAKARKRGGAGWGGAGKAKSKKQKAAGVGEEVAETKEEYRSIVGLRLDELEPFEIHSILS